MIEISHAKKRDLKEILELYKQLFSDMAALEPIYMQEADQDGKFLLECIKSQTMDIIVARKEKEILGLVLVCENLSPPYNAFIKKSYIILWI